MFHNIAREELVEWAEEYQEHSREYSTSEWESCSGHVGGFLRADWLADGAVPQKGSLEEKPTQGLPGLTTCGIPRLRHTEAIRRVTVEFKGRV